MNYDKNILERIDSRFHCYRCIDEEINYVCAKDLIHPKRLDIPVKIKYLEAVLAGNESEINRNRKYYKDTIQYFTDALYKEPGDSFKKSFLDFEKYFITLFNEIKENGFDVKKSIIPLSKDGMVLDGAHRVSIAYLLGLKIPTIKLNVESPTYDYSFYKRKGASREELLNFVRCYLSCDCSSRVAILWPYNSLSIDSVKRKYTDRVIYSDCFTLDSNGVRNLCLLAYKNEKWIGDVDNSWSGIKNKADACFVNNKETHFLFYKSLGGEDDIDLKNEIRALSDGSKNNIHTTDDIFETGKLSEFLLYSHGGVLLNNIELKVLSKIILVLQKNSISIDDVIVTGSSLMSLLGLRDANDIDLLHDENITITDTPEIGSHNKYADLYKINTKDILKKEDFFIDVFGVKFIRPEKLIDFKKNRGEEKDFVDIEKIIEAFDGNVKRKKMKNLRVSLNRVIRIYYFRYREFIVDFLRRNNILPLVKKILKRLNG
ncbi:hypothetical protein J5069_22300 [Candidatus Symbiopectobacterium sp. NZEC127]|uniref:hypothetical protein n=1 Tax=Candidatus Symbiopectobacterium sp. NZEC127 TaxID=2820472 RepID=UPI002225DF3F|nr:hypothetical protein [Candidatus Symbiopectobacterium sp. NZEC127]MCW2488639.1 hypothetical protein [Candidatus Symbiopectobacterium sp. NZEC127]